VRREIDGRPAAGPFRYRDLGAAAYISRGRAVVSAGPLHLGGFLGWWAWLFIHIGFLTGFRNRLGALVSWWLAFTRDLRRERTFTAADVLTARDVYSPGGGGPGEAAGPGQPPGPGGEPRGR
jgi:NADH dehydrogenase